MRRGARSRGGATTYVLSSPQSEAWRNKKMVFISHKGK